MGLKDFHKDKLWIEKTIDFYVECLDTGNIDGISGILEAAKDNLELELRIRQINEAYHEEEQITPIPPTE
ncbi:hypothetical protein [Lyngbya sp. PCC 8106]|uniref:hypothetical protein n=1 Tax=Lyngbya sp. (strain PCC 8106) TaxID=313612 RepID=UPI0000EA98E2|nr:hypothetical protein [Lyngbya sp. PCC 8106]EAW35202.1 hypothetical protein L8106_13845 [Lyngbya sp. PCC 8106]